MTQHIDDIILEWLSGTLSPAAEAEARAHIDTCPDCAIAWEAARQDFADLAATLKPVPPSDALRARIFENARPEARFLDLVDRVAALIDVPAWRAQEFLAHIDDATSWTPGPLPGVDIFHLSGGPAVDEAIVGFVRMQPGAGFPEHKHLGSETTLVLQGSYRDRSGVVYRYGQEDAQPAGSSHDFEALAGPPLIYLVVAFEGIHLGQTFIGPGDPRL